MNFFCWLLRLERQICYLLVVSIQQLLFGRLVFFPYHYCAVLKIVLKGLQKWQKPLASNWRVWRLPPNDRFFFRSMDLSAEELLDRKNTLREFENYFNDTTDALKNIVEKIGWTLDKTSSNVSFHLLYSRYFINLKTKFVKV